MFRLQCASESPGGLVAHRLPPPPLRGSQELVFLTNSQGMLRLWPWDHGLRTPHWACAFRSQSCDPALSLMPRATEPLKMKNGIFNKPHLSARGNPQGNIYHLNVTNRRLPTVHLFTHATRPTASWFQHQHLVIISLPQNYLITGFKTSIVVVIWGSQHLNIIGLWLQATWKLCILWVIHF